VKSEPFGTRRVLRVEKGIILQIKREGGTVAKKNRKSKVEADRGGEDKKKFSSEQKRQRIPQQEVAQSRIKHVGKGEESSYLVL